MTKAALRKIYRQKRTLLTDQERNKLDDLLLIQFQQLKLPGVCTIMSYASSETHAEPNTFLFTSYLGFRIPGLRMCYPVTSMSELSMKPVLVNDYTEFHLTDFGVEEPADGFAIDPLEIDMVMVPMLICDQPGFRVGFGKGFYDRFLATCRGDVMKVGFSYFEPVDRIDDTHQFDIPLNFCITPEKIIEFTG